jgi:A/G-specific adenine glycosylase
LAADDSRRARWLRERVLAWFASSGRAFPWRETHDPYHVLIAELLLQRTRADLVEPLYRRFVTEYPDAKALANADPVRVSEVLRPLGFAHRTARLPNLGRALVERHGGRIPRERADLLALPGVGEYVANAVRAVAFGEQEPLLDPNIIRLIGRVFGLRSDRARPRDDPALWSFIRSLLPRARAREFNLALVDLGAMVCRTRRPRCYSCPLRRRCMAFAAGEVTPSPTEAE